MNEEEDEVDGSGSEEHVNGYKYAEKKDEERKKRPLYPIFFTLLLNFSCFEYGRRWIWARGRKFGEFLKINFFCTFLMIFLKFFKF